MAFGYNGDSYANPFGIDRALSFEFQLSGSGYQDSGSGFQVSGAKVRVPAFRFRVSRIAEAGPSGTDGALTGRAQVLGLNFRVSTFGSRLGYWVFGFGVFGFRVSGIRGSGIRVSSFGSYLEFRIPVIRMQVQVIRRRARPAGRGRSRRMPRASGTSGPARPSLSRAGRTPVFGFRFFHFYFSSSNFGFRILVFGFRIPGLVSGFGFRVSGFGFRGLGSKPDANPSKLNCQLLI